MKPNRTTVAAVAGAATLLVGGGAAFAGHDRADASARCDDRLAKIAERRGVSVAELEAGIKARMLARVEAALAAKRITPERAAALRERIAEGELCKRPRGGHARIAVRGALAAAAHYLGLTKQELRAQLPGTSLAALAAKQGKSVEGLEAAMLAPARERLAKAVAAKRITAEQAAQALARMEQLVERIVAKTFPKK